VAPLQTARIVLVLLMALALGLMILLIRPFGTALFLAAVLAGALHPWMEWLARLLRGRRSIASGLLTAGVILAVVIPLTILAAVAVGEIVGGIEWVRKALAADGVGGLLDQLPGPLSEWARRAISALPQALEQLQSLAATQSGRAAAAVGGIITATSRVLLQTGIMLVALFFLMVDGRRLIRWLDEMIPLKRGQLAELLADFRQVTVAVMLSTLATAGTQTAVAIVGYLFGRVPNVLFFTFVTFILALVPLLGASLGVLIVALLQLATGHTVSGIFLLIWIVPVSLTDNVVKPLLMRCAGGIEIHAAVIFLSLLGGIAAFGPIGVIGGPLVVAFFVSVFRMYRRDFSEAD
jgi:predicted PurR-regulated permease PerM